MEQELNGEDQHTPMKFTDDFNDMVKIVFWNSFGFMFYLYIIPYIPSEYFKVDGLTLGILIAAQPFGRLFITPLVGYLTDKSSKKTLVLIGSLGRTLAYSVFYFSICLNSIISFGIAILLQGLLVGFFWPPLNTLIAEKSSKDYRSEAYGKRSGMIGWGGFTGALISFGLFNFAEYYLNGLVWVKFSPFIIFAIINVYAGFQFVNKVDENKKFVYKTLDLENNRKPSQNKNNNGKIAFVIGLSTIAIASMFSSMNDHISRPFIQLFMKETIYSLDLTVMLIIFSTQTIASIIAPKVGKIGDLIRPELGIGIIALCGGIITWILVNTSNPYLFVLFLLIDYILALAGRLFTQNLFSRISIKHRGKIFGAIEWMNLIGWIVGPILGGLVWDEYGFVAPFLLSIGFELILIPLYFVASKLLKKDIAEKI